ncbi:MAG: amidohydrolase family protein [Myxococcales bacterium]|nr:amidohydrolase family protein [Myxococcales bacterium]
MADRPLALVGGTIYVTPDADPIRDGIVFIKDGRVAAASGATVPPDTEVLSCAGCTILAGFCNNHVHFFERKWSNAAAIPAAELMLQLQEFCTRFGFTTVFDLSSPWANTRVMRERIESGEVPGPRIRSTGQGLIANGALPPDAVTNLMGVMRYPIATVGNATEVGAAAKRLVHEGVDGVKLFLKSFPVAGIAAAVAEARRAAKPVFVHPNDGADVLTALKAGVDVIAHTTPHSGPWDDALLAAIKRAALTPTITLWKSYQRHDRASAQEAIVATAVGQLKSWIDAGGTVLFGTDLGAVDPDPTEEYELMAAAGMTFRDILRSLTTAPGERFGRPVGRITAGLDADIAVVNGDPAKDVRALADVRYTLRGGKVIYRAAEP